MDCINCGQEVADKFCAHCGQRTGVKRITLKEGWIDFWSRAYGFDGMFPRTLRDLTLRPGKAALEYIQGNRAKYYGPVGYFFLMITLLLLLLSFLGLEYSELINHNQNIVAPNQNPKLGRIASSFIADYLKLFAFIMIPFQAISARFIFLRKSGYNLLENMVLPFYISGHLSWITMLMFIYSKISGEMPSGLILLILKPLFFGYAYMSFIPHQPKLKTFLKGIGIDLVGQFLFILTLTIAVIIVILLLAWLNPEVFEMIRPSNNR
jgi:NADH:ubiquinone oxidoreductase subunit 6 (subunit J)